MVRSVFVAISLLFPIYSFSAVIYVDNQNPQCVEEALGAGSSSMPYCRIVPAVESARAGDTVFVSAGTYDSEPRSAQLVYSGLPGSPIRILSNGAEMVGPCTSHPCYPNEWKTNQHASAFKIYRANHIIIDGFTFRDYGRSGVDIFESDFVEVKNSFFDYLGGTAVLALGSKNITISGNRFDYVNLGVLGDVISPETGFNVFWKGHEAVSVKTQEGQRLSENILVLNNFFNHSFHEGPTFGKVERGYMIGNTVNHMCAVGMYVLSGENNTVALNRVQHSGKIQVPSRVNLTDLYRARGRSIPAQFPSGIVHCNDLANLPYGRQQGGGIAIGSCDLGQRADTDEALNHFVGGNLITDTVKGAVSTHDHCPRIKRTGTIRNIGIYHNTIYRAGTYSSSSVAGWFGTGTSNAAFANNIIAESNRGFGYPRSLQNISLYNNFYDNVGAGTWGSAATFGDAGFVNPSGGNFTLSSASEAIDVGSRLRPALFAFPYCGAMPDAGAFEFCP